MWQGASSYRKNPLCNFETNLASDHKGAPNNYSDSYKFWGESNKETSLKHELQKGISIIVTGLYHVILCNSVATARTRHIIPNVSFTKIMTILSPCLRWNQVYGWQAPARHHWDGAPLFLLRNILAAWYHLPSISRAVKSGSATVCLAWNRLSVLWSLKLEHLSQFSYSYSFFLKLYRNHLQQCYLWYCHFQLLEEITDVSQRHQFRVLSWLFSCLCPSWETLQSFPCQIFSYLTFLLVSFVTSANLRAFLLMPFPQPLLHFALQPWLIFHLLPLHLQTHHGESKISKFKLNSAGFCLSTMVLGYFFAYLVSPFY